MGHPYTYRTSLPSLPIHLQVWQSPNHVVIITPINLDCFRKTVFTLSVLFTQKMLLPSSPPYYFSLSRHSEPLRRRLVSLHFVPSSSDDSESRRRWIGTFLKNDWMEKPRRSYVLGRTQFQWDDFLLEGNCCESDSIRGLNWRERMMISNVEWW